MAKIPNPIPQTADDLLIRIGARFDRPAWAMLPQVRSATGFGDCRTADAIAMSVWPSRGLHLHGFEIKVNRGDWLRELKQPSKAEEIAQFCDFWWVVAPKDMVALVELPATWGLLIPYRDTLKTVKQPTLLKAEQIDKSFLAAILRRAQEIVTPQSRYEANYRRGYDEGQKHADDRHEHDKKDHAAFECTVEAFEKASGVHISQWSDGKEIGEAVRMILNGEHVGIKREMVRLLVDAKQIVSDLERRLESKALVDLSAEA